MKQTTPSAVRIVAAYDDGQDARHFELAPLSGESIASAVEPGQFFMLSVPGAGEAAFTYAAPPDARGHVQALVRRVGALTSRLFELEPGAVLGLRGPFGRGWPLAELRAQRVLVIAGGCGLAPLCSAVDHLAARGAGALAVIYGARNPDSQVLGVERGRWSGRFPLLETYDHPDDPDQIRGTPIVRLDEACQALGGAPEAALVCGPELMMTRVAAALRDRGLGAGRIWLSLERRMHCGDGRCGHCYLGPSYVCQDGPTYRLDEFQRLQAESPPRATELVSVHHC
ncbi:MAG: FAD/NAD(P)-binding protein [Myxococcales bacterium]|nr:FAD/NAD(P)-binding protein [Myxococcales bacterium]